ncbi:MAG: nucleotide sugar dehydrogenase [Candidatus Izemoplasmatales bacterium]|jgi:UDP-N-acetyl-D-galactosamine dehydrogenase
MPLKIAVIGMGYVGLPIAVAFSEKGIDVIGFDINKAKIQSYINGVDPTHEIGHERLRKAVKLKFTANEADLDLANFFIVAVPTPVLPDKTPDLEPLKSASKIVGRHLNKGDYVVYESTVYPGATESICVPLLEASSQLKGERDFKYGYSPERINPGDQIHRLETIVKVVSGCDIESRKRIKEVYEIVCSAGVYEAETIKTAEAAKVIENSQRDLNVAFMNELAIIFDKMDIDTIDVLNAAGTKWNFLPFRPGLVGGHCIGVDPYYLTYKAQMEGYMPEVILAGRRINDSMGKFIAEKTIKKLINAGINVKRAKILILGLTFKEDCPDIRNSKVVDIYYELKEYQVGKIIVSDPLAEAIATKNEYGIDLVDLNAVSDVDCIIIAVKHQAYCKMSIDDYERLYDNTKQKRVLIDVKAVMNKEDAVQHFDYWRL